VRKSGRISLDFSELLTVFSFFSSFSWAIPATEAIYLGSSIREFQSASYNSGFAGSQFDNRFLIYKTATRVEPGRFRFPLSAIE
jgi:hypothetical protein